MNTISRFVSFALLAFATAVAFAAPVPKFKSEDLNAAMATVPGAEIIEPVPGAAHAAFSGAWETSWAGNGNGIATALVVLEVREDSLKALYLLGRKAIPAELKHAGRGIFTWTGPSGAFFKFEVSGCNVIVVRSANSSSYPHFFACVKPQPAAKAPEVVTDQ